MKETNWNRGSWIALAASIFLQLLVLGVNVYRFTLPTDGWGYGDFENSTAVNLLHLPSQLEVGDLPVTIGGVSANELENQPLGQAVPLPANWRPGETVQYTVTRGDETFTFPVPVGNWNLGALWNGFAEDGADYLIAFLYFAIGAFLFVLRPGNVAAQVLLFLGSVRLTMTLTLVIPIGISDLGNVFTLAAVGLLGFYIWGILLFPTFFLLSLVFPKPKRPFRTHPVLTLAGLYLLEPILLVTFGSMSAETGPTIGFGLVAVFGLLTVLSILHSIITERGDAVARAQIVWVGLGIALVAGFQFVENSIGFTQGQQAMPEPLIGWINLINGLVYLAVPATVAIAVLRYRLFDIDIIIRKTLTYTIVVVLLLIVYFGVVISLEQVLAIAFGQQSEIVTVLSTLAIAGLFVPLRNRIQGLIDRRFYRKKYDAQQVLNEFAKTVRDETDLEKLTGRLMQVVDETMQPKSTSVWLKTTAGQRQRDIENRE